jgi:hypothetical protein
VTVFKESATVLHIAEASDRIQSSINASSIASNGATMRDATKSLGCTNCNYYEWLKTRLPGLHPVNVEAFASNDRCGIVGA